ncbi:type I-E CRISPR-associated protein Cse2/CasB [uncultured Tessaracoccus sp.]|uniref:type I-E CRISPR-associated protein Cse2/CasB n=1 Tax=uncultured Tessaracoccus sp. TaxID=905023 RepID=UPI0025EB7895|nr:type I-E CRISPR-associated protein Cse2/CasB [uncultured Tessaracoccus sp.]
MSEPFRCGQYVVTRIRQLVGTDAATMSPNTRAVLAQLRQALGKEAGTVPAVWPVTLEGVPEMRAQQQRHVEAALHLALTLFVLHQQAQPRCMHDPSRSFGSAIRRLADQTASEEGPHTSPAYRRFTAACTTTDVRALETHLRGLVTQLRSADIGFDYDGFADDLYFFQVPGRAVTVQRRWGRQFHHLNSTHATTPTALEGASK